MSGSNSYDVAVIGGGPEGLIAAIALARAGMNTIVLERDSRVGGRAVTKEFYPGFRSSPFTDELPAIPDEIFWAADLARLGATFLNNPSSVCVSEANLKDGGATALFTGETRFARTLSPANADDIARLKNEVAALVTGLAAHAAAPSPRQEHSFGKAQRNWPGESWGMASLDALLSDRLRDPRLRLHLTADVLSGRAASPLLAGSGLHLLTLGAGHTGLAAGGLGSLGTALARATEVLGVTIRLNANVADICLRAGSFGSKRAVGVALKSGEEVSAKAVLSTLDLKQSFLSLIDWKPLGETLIRRVGQFRMRGQSARVLFALDRTPSLGAYAEYARGVFHVAPSPQALSRSHELWSAGVLDDAQLVTIRFPSVADPLLAPSGKAVMAATLSPIPSLLFDGSWTKEKRDRIATLALEAAERIAPGVTNLVLASEVIVPTDMEQALGVTAGDLDGGEIAPDQIFSHRPFPGWNGRTPVKGFYLGGASLAPAPFFTGAASWRAAEALIADLKSGIMR